MVVLMHGRAYLPSGLSGVVGGVALAPAPPVIRPSQPVHDRSRVLELGCLITMRRYASSLPDPRGRQKSEPERQVAYWIEAKLMGGRTPGRGTDASTGAG
ncbi:MAG TPA: hypothetical protein VNO23_15160, partial [Candidatus Binatia bacterium]|nr:hypothetical protein [Candidatus Binatia bacterium]